MRDSLKSRTLLHWYDANARVLPWRISPENRKAGQKPDPYHVWLSEIMLQQTTVVTVKSYFLKFLDRWPSVDCLAAARDEDVMAEWAGLGYYARARNLLKCARIINADHDNLFPQTQEALLKLPGIGPYTAAAIGAIAFDHRTTVLDGNVERVMARLHRVSMPLPAAKNILRSHAEHLTPKLRSGDYAQAVMDLGATICTPRKPSCGVCPWRQGCLAYQAGDAEIYPVKLPKQAKPIRLGIVYVAQKADGSLLLERRPDKGLLGGMLGWPGSEWGEKIPDHKPPADLEWRELGEEVRHTFTHFHLRLRVFVGLAGDDDLIDRGRFIARIDYHPADLPTVMRKVWQLSCQAGQDEFGACAPKASGGGILRK